jgi:hypothetical protein
VSLLKFMIGGLLFTAVSAAVTYAAFGEAPAFIVAIVVGIITQHGSLAAAAFGWPYHGFWE